MDQSQPGGQLPPPRPKNWLVESILVTIFCCLPFGIAGIVFASSVNSRYDMGDYAGALVQSQQAGKWTKIGFWVGIGGIVLYILFLFVFGMSFLSLARFNAN
jgi:Interferon-induced transmembrane protein